VWESNSPSNTLASTVRKVERIEAIASVVEAGEGQPRPETTLESLLAWLPDKRISLRSSWCKSGFMFQSPAERVLSYLTLSSFPGV
jgi:hypothetical protein